MDRYTLLVLAFTVMTVTAWSAPYYPVHRPYTPLRVTRYAPHPPHRIPLGGDGAGFVGRAPNAPVRYKYAPPPQRLPIPAREEEPKYERPKRDHDDYEHDHDHDGHKETSGVTGPVHTFVKTDKNANYKWGVRHHVGNKYAS